MIAIEVIAASTLHRLAALPRTPNAEPWVAEVEEFVFGVGPAMVLRSGAGQALLATIAGEPIGAAVHSPHEQFLGAELVSGVVISSAYRGRGHALGLIELVIRAARAHSGRRYVIWMVHDGNAPMLHLSKKVAGQPTDKDGEYFVFVHDD